MRTSSKKVSHFVVVIFILSGLSFPSSAVADTYTFITIDNPLGVNGTNATGISGNNIVGNYWDALNVSHGFLYNGSNYTTIDAPSAALGTAAAAIDGNNIVGSYRDAANIAHGFIYNIVTSTYTTIDHPLTADLTAATGIWGNNIVGYFGYGYQGGEIGATGYNGFLYNILTSTFTTIDHPLGPYGSFASDIDGNNIVGRYGDAGQHNHGFLYNISTKTYTTFDDPLGVNGSIPNGISGNTVVGYYSDRTTGKAHGFLHDISTGTYTTFDNPFAVNSSSANGISGSNIVGGYDTHGYLATPTPEPSTLALLVAAAIGLIGYRWRRRLRSAG